MSEGPILRVQRYQSDMVRQMELHHLRYFVAVAEELHFGQAAHRLRMAQPPLSQRIRDLERELGVRLFDRNPRRVVLTEGGALLLEHARRVLDDVDAVHQVMGRVRSGGMTALRVGVPPDTSPSMLATMIDRFESVHPEMLVELREATTNEQVRDLRSGELDIGVVRHPCDTVGLDCSASMRRPLGVLMPSIHELAGDSTIHLRDLNGSALVVFPRKMASRLYDHILTVCRDHGFMPGKIRHARNPNFIQGLVLAGLGIHLNEEPPHELPAGLTWRPIHDEPLSWVTTTAWAPSNHRPVLADLTEAVFAGLEACGHEHSESRLSRMLSGPILGS